MALKRGEFKELSEEVVDSKCCQTEETERTVESDNEKDNLELTPTSPSAPVKYVNKIKTPKRLKSAKFNTSPMLGKISSQSPELISSMFSQCSVVKTEAVPPTIKPEMVVKQEEEEEQYGNNSQYPSPPTIKPEPMDVDEADPSPPPPVVMKVAMSQNEETSSIASSCEVGKTPGASLLSSFSTVTPTSSSSTTTPDNLNIDIDNIGNLESIFVMLHKDSEEEADNIDVNSFLANL